MGFGKFQSLVSIIVLVLQVAVVGTVGANSRTFQVPDILQWACETSLFEEESFDLAISSTTNHLQRRTAWGLCNRIRGGRLGRSSSSVAEEVEAQPENETQTDAEIATATVVIEKTPEAEIIDYSSSKYAFPLFQENDGSQTDPDGIPARYLKMQKDDREKAKKALEGTIKWREENDINTILARPHPKLDVCKKVFPHYFCGRDDTNHVILLQRPGLIDLPLAHANGLVGEDLLYHYIYEMEYLWQILEGPTPDATMTSIIDLTGLNLSVLTKAELIHVVKLFCSTMDAHFPTRSHKTLLINSPRWFGTIYKIISPLLRESTKKKITILSKGKKQDEALKELLSECPIPEDGGKLEEIPPSEMEHDLRDFVSTTLIHSFIRDVMVTW
jgi:hypothetical protein